MYKKQSNDTIYVGPVWDFDLAFDNDNRTYPVNNKTDYIYRSGGSSAGYMRTLTDQIVVYDAAAKQQLKDLWAQIRRSGFTEEAILQYIDDQAEMLNESQELNFIRWPIMNQYVHLNPRIRGSYEAEVENIRSYISKRISWMDKKMGFDAKTLAIDKEPSDQVSSTKVLRDGRIMILRNGKSYTMDGRVCDL